MKFTQQNFPESLGKFDQHLKNGWEVSLTEPAIGHFSLSEKYI